MEENEIKTKFGEAKEALYDLERLVSKVKVKNNDGYPLISKNFKMELWRMKKKLTNLFVCEIDYGVINLWDEINRYKK